MMKHKNNSTRYQPELQNLADMRAWPILCLEQLPQVGLGAWRANFVMVTLNPPRGHAYQEVPHSLLTLSTESLRPSRTPPPLATPASTLTDQLCRCPNLH
jgi:hypothetical protein